MADQSNMFEGAVLSCDVAHQAGRVTARCQVIDFDQALLAEIKLFPQDLRRISCP